MTAETDTMSTLAAPAPRVLNPTRPFYWSVRRELWENRSVYIAPLAVAGVVLFGYVFGALHPPHVHGHFMANDAHGLAVIHALPFNIAAIALIVTSSIVGVFYCLGALHNERRDRSVLFWKSLPVSDLTTVLSKFFVPMVVLPVVVFCVAVATHIVMLLLGSALLPIRGESATILWTTVPLVQLWGVLAWGLAALTLWAAPVWGWLLLVGAWAKRAPFLWAVLPPLALDLVEQLALGTSYVSKLITYRLNGGVGAAFSHQTSPDDAALGLLQPDPAGFFSTPGLWAGLAFAALCLAAMVWLRRTREPI
jgi:ABC-2 type transport system permease protein